jgi:hypothetical protein
MRANSTVSLLTMSFYRQSPASDPRNGSSQRRLARGKQPLLDAETGGLDAYKIAVVFLVGAAILSLF